MFISRETILNLNTVLSLNATGNEQDWDLEFADEGRLNDFIATAQKKNPSSLERYAIMALILASFDDYLEKRKDNTELTWQFITELLNDNYANYQDLLNYWAVWGQANNKDYFNITPFVRAYLNRSQSNL